MHRTEVRLVALTLFAASGGCSDWQNTDTPSYELPADGCSFESDADADLEGIPYPRGLRAVGNRIEDRDGNAVFLRGVNRSGTEYQCTKNAGIFDGPSDEASILAMKSWNVNAVRVPLNEYCWRGGEKVLERYSGCNYKRAIKDYVALLHRHEIVPILDLHWATPGEIVPTDLYPMPNADHTPEFWRDVARTFMDDDGVIFEPYNEPFFVPNRDSDAAWQCWRDGCRMTFGGQATTYQAVGMQALVDAIRETGSTHLILLGGVQYSNALSQWLEHQPFDPLGNLGAAWHVYNFNACSDESCWNDAPARVAAEVPVVATELGQNDCAGTMISPLMDWLDARGSGYLAWSWNALGPCVAATMEDPGQPWSLITDYGSGQPNGGYAQTFYDRLQQSAD